MNAVKSKTSVASFQQTSQPRAAQTHDDPAMGRHVLFSSQSRASYSRPPPLLRLAKTKTQAPARGPEPKKKQKQKKGGSAAILRLDLLATGTHGVLSHENHPRHLGGLFFTYKTLRRIWCRGGTLQLQPKSTTMSGM